MPDFSFPPTLSGFNLRVRFCLILVIMLISMILFTACGDQPTSAAFKGGLAGTQAASTASSVTQAQSQAASTSSPSKATPKPGVTAANAAPGTTHICSLLTKDQVAVSIGGTDVVTDDSRDALGEFGGAGCNYTSSTGSLSTEVTIAGQSQADFEKTFKFNNAQVVPSLGTTAFFLDGQLSTLKGKVGVVVFLLNPAKGSETLSNATDVTREILTSLEKTSHANDLTATST